VIQQVGAGRPTLILFADRHCYTCLQMIEVFAALRERAPREAALFLVDPQRADPATALLLTRYGVWVTPTTVFIDRTGRAVRTLHGYYALPALLQELGHLADR
jgi:thiol:disulfide interchange protein